MGTKRSIKTKTKATRTTKNKLKIPFLTGIEKAIKTLPTHDCQNVVSGFERSLFLKSFADAGRSPTMTDVEIAVCFSDLRGFTKYVNALQSKSLDNRVHHFLRSYFAIYPEAVLKTVWWLEPQKEDEEITADANELRRLIVPTSYKNLGDGMMIVWELQDASDGRMQGLATHQIYIIINVIRRLFSALTTQFGPVETDIYSDHVKDLKLGFGLARGHAWRLDFGSHLPRDYAGSIVNLAARLQGYARPEGIVSQLSFSEALFRALTEEDKGSIKTIRSLKGIEGQQVEVWMSDEVKLENNILGRIKNQGRQLSKK